MFSTLLGLAFFEAGWSAFLPLCLYPSAHLSLVWGKFTFIIFQILFIYSGFSVKSTAPPPHRSAPTSIAASAPSSHCFCLADLWVTSHLLTLGENLTQSETKSTYLGSLRLPLCFLELLVAQLLSRVWLFATPWTEAHQASLSSTVSWSSLRFMSI